jgi:hypothetical protein
MNLRVELSSGQTRGGAGAESMPMYPPDGLRVITAETLQGNALIVFSDGVTAIYPASLLQRMLAQAQEVHEELQDDLDA